MSRIGSVMMAVALVFVATAATAGPKIDVSEDSWVQLGLLGQAHVELLPNADEGVDAEDVLLRRARIILKGQIQDGITFFVETDNDQQGNDGVQTSMDVQDAWMDVRMLTKDNIDISLRGGLILLPFSFENRSSACSLLGLDYNADVIQLDNTFVWRDYGVEAHGKVMKKVAYHVGVFDGDGANADARARVTGHVAMNLIGDVDLDAPFDTQNALGEKGKYLSVGVGGDYHQGAQANGDDSDAWVVDFQSNFEFTQGIDLLVNGGYYGYNNTAMEGNTAFIEGGALYRKCMVTLKHELVDADDADEVANLTAGLHYFMKGQNARAGVEYRTGDSDDLVLGGIQFLL